MSSVLDLLTTEPLTKEVVRLFNDWISDNHQGTKLPASAFTKTTDGCYILVRGLEISTHHTVFAGYDPYFRIMSINNDTELDHLKYAYRVVIVIDKEDAYRKRMVGELAAYVESIIRSNKIDTLLC